MSAYDKIVIENPKQRKDEIKEILTQIFI